MGIIRALLAISVLITHSGKIFGVRMLNGDMAVTCFFVISGFLMGLIVTEKYKSIKDFYINRALRIYPAYLLAVILSYIAFTLFPQGSHNPPMVLTRAIEHKGFIWIIWSAISNVSLLGIDLTRYIKVAQDYSILFPNFLHGGGGGGHNLLLVPQAWTLALEFYFYLIVPFVVKLRTPKLVAATAFFFILRWQAHAFFNKINLPVDDSSIFIFQVQYFLIGVVSYRLYAWFRSAGMKKNWKDILGSTSFTVGLLMVFGGYDIFGNKEQWLVDIFYTAFAVLLPFIFYWCNKTFSSLDKTIGDYSYPVYLFHYMVAKSLLLLTSDKWYGELSLAITLVISFLYLFFIDNHVQRLRVTIAEKSTKKRKLGMQPESIPVNS